MIIKSFRFRLTLLYATVVMLMFIVFAFYIFSEYRKDLYEALDRDLISDAKYAAKNWKTEAAIGRTKTLIRKLGDEYYQILNTGKGVLIGSLNKDGQSPLSPELMNKAFKGTLQFDNVIFKAERSRTLYFPVNPDTILRLSASLEDLEEKISALRNLSLIFLPFVLVTSFLVSWFLAGRSLAPVVKIRALAERIRNGDLSERINIGLKGREIDSLVTTFNGMLDSMNRSIEAQKRFTSDVSHEIRSPLTSLRGSIEVALRRQRSPEEYQELLHDSLSDIIRLSRITDNLLFLSRADNNIHELRMQWFTVSSLLKGLMVRLGPRAVEAQVTMDCVSDKDFKIRGDIDLLDEAFSNLMENAIKYTPRGGSVTLKALEKETSVVISVSDTGIGIPVLEVPHIFERFYRVSKERSRKFGGTGLGLAITQWIVNAHHGDIAVISKEGSGSAFTVTLPKILDQP